MIRDTWQKLWPCPGCGEVSSGPGPLVVGASPPGDDDDEDDPGAVELGMFITRMCERPQCPRPHVHITIIIH